MLLSLLFMTGFLAGLVDAIAGGGGLISLPILLSTGMSPHLALGTNKLQGSIGALVTTFRYHRLGLVSFKSASVGLIAGAIGSALGAATTLVIDGGALNKIIPAVLIAILIYTLCKPKLGKEDIHPRVKQIPFYLAAGFSLGFYDGFLGPAVGSFWLFLLAFFLGFNFMKATAYAKVFNLNSSLIALGCFAIGNSIDYRTAFVMAAGQLIGARLGSGLAIKRGVRLIRPLFLCVVTGTVTSLLYRDYGHADLSGMTNLVRDHHLMPLIAVLTLSVGSYLAYAMMLRRKNI
jgi:uncharacterized membrane protein YfcA